MRDDQIHEVIEILRRETKKWDVPIVTLMSQTERNPFKILIATVLSLRTKDEVTAKAADRLFQVADNPYDMIKIDEEEIAALIYPVGFYRRKAKNIKEICKVLINKYDGISPS